MAASMTALVTVVWSDYAEASESAQVEFSDELTDAQPVKLVKIEHKQPDELLEFGMPQPMKVGKRKGRLNFGSFEGY